MKMVCPSRIINEADYKSIIIHLRVRYYAKQDNLQLFDTLFIKWLFTLKCYIQVIISQKPSNVQVLESCKRILKGT